MVNLDIFETNLVTHLERYDSTKIVEIHGWAGYPVHPYVKSEIHRHKTNVAKMGWNNQKKISPISLKRRK